jgi:hypothetical protein
MTLAELESVAIFRRGPASNGRVTVNVTKSPGHFTYYIDGVSVPRNAISTPALQPRETSPSSICWS